MLQECGSEVHGTYRSRPPSPGIIAHHAILPEDASAVIGRVRPEVVIHLACPISHSTDSAQYDRLRTGILDATMAVAAACHTHGARLLHVGSCAEYGDHPAPYHEAMAPRPVSPYATLKAAASMWVLSLTRSSDLQATVVRPFRAIGTGDQSSVVSLALRAAIAGTDLALTDGAQVREWNDVSAIAHGLLAAAAHPGTLGETLNLGGGPQLSVRQIVEMAFDIADGDPAHLRFGALPRRPGEVALFCGDHRRAAALLGPLPHPPVEQTLHDALAWIRDADHH
ncbi:MAG: nucleoside-diphosphate-sugar epimerase [Myxococcota bacterium]